jgi:hypothetical protein
VLQCLKNKRPPGGRPYCIEFVDFYLTIELPELVTVTGLPALTTWALWA